MPDKDNVKSIPPHFPFMKDTLLKSEHFLSLEFHLFSRHVVCRSHEHRLAGSICTLLVRLLQRELGHSYLHDDLAEGGAVGGDVEEDPDGGHCALDWVDPSGLERGR